MPRIGSFGPPIRIKYKLELDHVFRVAVNKHVFVEDLLTVYSSCKLKTRQDERQGIKLPLEAIAFYSDSFVALKINVEQKVAENWAPYCIFRSGGCKLQTPLATVSTPLSASKDVTTCGL